MAGIPIVVFDLETQRFGPSLPLSPSCDQLHKNPFALSDRNPALAFDTSGRTESTEQH
jgi:hypothetical protein